MTKTQVRALLVLASAALSALAAFGVVPPAYVTEVVGAVSGMLGLAAVTPGKS